MNKYIYGISDCYILGKEDKINVKRSRYLCVFFEKNYLIIVRKVCLFFKWLFVLIGFFMEVLFLLIILI